MANQRLAHLIDRYTIQMTTPQVRSSGLVLPTPYTLLYDGRTLEGKMNANGTISCLKALSGTFAVAESKLPGQRKAKKDLITFLGTEYEAFLQAYLEDEAEEMRGQILDIRPDPPGRKRRERELPFRPLFDDDLTFGMRVVSFDRIAVPKVYVGRIEEVRPTCLEEMAETGRVADIVLLQADRHEELADRFCQQFLYGSSDPPSPGVYPWPESLPEQTFKWPKRPTHLVTLPLMTIPFEITILSSLDFLQEPDEKDKGAQYSEDSK